MKASERSKQLGVDLSVVAEKFGCSRQNLEHKHKNKPHQFDIICRGVKSEILK